MCMQLFLCVLVEGLMGEIYICISLICSKWNMYFCMRFCGGPLVDGGPGVMDNSILNYWCEYEQCNISLSHIGWCMYHMYLFFKFGDFVIFFYFIFFLLKDSWQDGSVTTDISHWQLLVDFCHRYCQLTDVSYSDNWLLTLTIAGWCLSQWPPPFVTDRWFS